MTCSNDCVNSATPALVWPASLVNVTAQRPETSALSVSGCSKNRQVDPSSAANGSTCRSPPDRSNATSPLSFRPVMRAVSVFVKPGIVSTTTSAANRYADLSADHLATVAWEEVRAALELSGPRPPWRVVREKRATFAATADQERRRPGPRTGLSNLALAGDWTNTGLPATIEGAIRSGVAAAQEIQGK